MNPNNNYLNIDFRAPRVYKKVFNLLVNSNKGFYEKLREKNPNLSKYTNSELRKSIEFFNRRIAQEVIQNRNGIKLPEGLGIVVAGLCKYSKKCAEDNINFRKSLDLKEIVTYQNLHSDTYVCRIKYTNEMERYVFENHQLWCFDPDRNLSRGVSGVLNQESGFRRYIVFTTKQHIAHLFRKPKIQKHLYIQKREEQLLASYNEFEIN